MPKTLFDLIQDVKFVVDQLLTERSKVNNYYDPAEQKANDIITTHPIVIESMESAIQLIFDDRSLTDGEVAESDLVTYIIMLISNDNTPIDLQLKCIQALLHIMQTFPTLLQDFDSAYGDPGPVLLVYLDKKLRSDLHTHITAAFDCVGLLFSHANPSSPLSNRSLLRMKQVIVVSRSYMVRYMSKITCPSYNNHQYEVQVIHAILESFNNITSVFGPHFDPQAADIVNILLPYYDLIVLDPRSSILQYHPLCLEPLIETIFNITSRFAEYDLVLGEEVAERYKHDRRFRLSFSDTFLIQLLRTLVFYNHRYISFRILSILRYCSTTQTLLPQLSSAQVYDYLVLRVVQDFRFPQHLRIINDGHLLIEALGIIKNKLKYDIETLREQFDPPSVPLPELFLSCLLSSPQDGEATLQTVSAGCCIACLSEIMPYCGLYFTKWDEPRLLAHLQFLLSFSSIDCSFYLITSPLVTEYQGTCLAQQYYVIERITGPIIAHCQKHGYLKALSYLIKSLAYLISISAVAYTVSVQPDDSYVVTTRSRRHSILPIPSTTFHLQVPAWYDASYRGNEKLVLPPIDTLQSPISLTDLGVIATTHHGFLEFLQIPLEYPQPAAVGGASVKKEIASSLPGQHHQRTTQGSHHKYYCSAAIHSDSIRDNPIRDDPNPPHTPLLTHPETPSIPSSPPSPSHGQSPITSPSPKLSTITSPSPQPSPSPPLPSPSPSSPLPPPQPSSPPLSPTSSPLLSQIALPSSPASPSPSQLPSSSSPSPSSPSPPSPSPESIPPSPVEYGADPEVRILNAKRNYPYLTRILTQIPAPLFDEYLFDMLANPIASSQSQLLSMEPE